MLKKGAQRLKRVSLTVNKHNNNILELTICDNEQLLYFKVNNKTYKLGVYMKKVENCI